MPKIRTINALLMEQSQMVEESCNIIRQSTLAMANVSEALIVEEIKSLYNRSVELKSELNLIQSQLDVLIDSLQSCCEVNIHDILGAK